MIALLCGENDFELTKKLAQLKADFKGTPERYMASELTNEQLADIFSGQSLFALERLIIIDTPSGNSTLWQDLPMWVGRLNENTQLLLIESKPDKRTSAYKWLKKNVDVQEFTLFDERDIASATNWLLSYATQQQVTLTTAQAKRLIERGGTNQWALAQAIDKLQLAGEVTNQWIDDSIEQNPSQNVFQLFETVLQSDHVRMSYMLSQLRLTEDPYRVFGLMTSQALQLTLLVYAGGDTAKIATSLGMKSSYPLQKIAPFANRLTKSQISKVVHLFADADERLKSSDADPWLVLESTLVRVASLIAE